MQSKRSFFNKPLFLKNLTRFAPVWVMYIICLLGGVALTYVNHSGDRRLFWFAANFSEDVMAVMAVVNLLYAPLCAALLFGDLYNSRMCNALHAFPLSRESYFLTNLLSGVSFSLIPTVVTALISAPLLAGSIIRNAWVFSPLFVVSANLQFLCFFGIALLCVMCTGNRFTMAAAYGLVNFGAQIAYWMVDTVYTPLLYGVITPQQLSNDLTPLVHMLGYEYYKIDPFSPLMDIVSTTGQPLSQLSAGFTLTGEWWRLFACAGAGLLFAGAAMLLYRRRQLECAGDAVAFRWLVPVFQVLCSMFVMVAALYVTTYMFGIVEGGTVFFYCLLALGLAIGWIISQMLVERSTRIFRMKNFCGLGLLAAAVTVSLLATSWDIFGIETRLPELEKIASVEISTNRTQVAKLTEEEDIKQALLIQDLTLDNRPEDWGTFVRAYDGTLVELVDSNEHLFDLTQDNPDYTTATHLYLNYTMENGRIIRRRYNIWVYSMEGGILRDILSRWELLDRTIEEDGQTFSELDQAMETFEYLFTEWYTGEEKAPEVRDKEAVREFINALRLDCEEGNMVSDCSFHRGYFRDPVLRGEGEEAYYQETDCIYVYIRGRNAQGRSYNWRVQVHADADHAVAWLREQGLLTFDIITGSPLGWEAMQERR